MQLAFFALLIVFLNSCENSNKKNNGIDIERIVSKHNNIKINQPLPFGVDFTKISISSKNISTAKVNGLLDIFNRIHLTKNILKINIKNPDTSYNELPKYFNDSLATKATNVIYRLSNINGNQAFYSFERIKNHPIAATYELEGSYCQAAGNLILYNMKTKKYYLVNIFLIVSSPYTNFSKMFYIDKQNIIHILEIEGDEEANIIKANYTIKILSNGVPEFINYYQK